VLSTLTAPRPALDAQRAPRAAASALGRGTLVLYLSIVVILPVAALLAHAGTPADFVNAIKAHEARTAILLSLGASVIVALVNLAFGTLIAWVLVRDSFRGRRVVDALVDLPFALPTIVAGLILLALYGKGGLDLGIAYTRGAVVLALLFVTLPFTVRAVQPVLLELDPAMEEAAATLGARPATIARRIVLPALLPAMLSGAALSFARALGEFGSLVLITGNLPNHTEAASVYIFGQTENGATVAPAAISVMLLLIAVAALAAIALFTRRRTGHER
jgi:sulfate/thiosulfate transport system permease protein